MKSDHFEQCCPAKIAGDETVPRIVAAQVTPSPADVEPLLAVLEPIENDTGEWPVRCSADAGSESHAEVLEARRSDGQEPDPRWLRSRWAANPGDPARSRLYRETFWPQREPLLEQRLPIF